MRLNHLNGWQRLALVLTAIYWVGVVGAGVQAGIEVGSYTPPTPAEQADYARATAPLEERIAEAQKAGEAAAAATPPGPDVEAQARAYAAKLGLPPPAPKAPTLDPNGMPLGELKSADTPAVFDPTKPYEVVAPNGQRRKVQPGMFDDLIPKGAPPRPPFAWPPFWLIMGMGAGGYAAIAGLVWAGLGFRKRQPAT